MEPRLRSFRPGETHRNTEHRSTPNQTHLLSPIRQNSSP